MPPHVRRGGTRGRSNTPRHAAQACAGLSAGRSAPRTQGKFAAFDEFCKRLWGVPFCRFVSVSRRDGPPPRFVDPPLVHVTCNTCTRLNRASDATVGKASRLTYGVVSGPAPLGHAETRETRISPIRDLVRPR